jgi:phospholipase/carboxylesterase
VLSIDRTSRVIVPRLRSAGYDIQYHEFDGPHAIPMSLLKEATTWMATT